MKERKLLELATAALRDIAVGFPHDEIAASHTMGLDALLVELVTHLRGRCINDDHAWDCDATRGIPVASPSKSVEDMLYEDLAELKGAGLHFALCTRLFGETNEQSPYVAAARDQAREGELEIDDRAMVSKGDDDGAYVSAWLWVSNEAAGVVPYPEALEAMLDAARVNIKRGVPIGITLLDAETHTRRQSAYADWLEDLISNFSDELDAIETEESPDRERAEITWVDANDESHRFYPSDALAQLRTHATLAVMPEGPAKRRAFEFVDKHARALDRILSVLQTA